ncbi:MAG: hypothetical protein IIY58_05145, partial [Aeriscardovia sp.]|nr:hypothetical protein [Aeriscardovia sp.]
LREAENRLTAAKNAYDESECDEAYSEYTAAKRKVEDADRQWDAAYENWIGAKNDCYTVWNNWKAVKD